MKDKYLEISRAAHKALDNMAKEKKANMKQCVDLLVLGKEIAVTKFYKRHNAIKPEDISNKLWSTFLRVAAKSKNKKVINETVISAYRAEAEYKRLTLQDLIEVYIDEYG